MRPYESDALTAYRQLPMVVVLPRTVEEVSGVLRYCHANGIKVVPRGAGTSLSGGALAARRRRPARHGAVQPHPRDRLRQPRRGGRAGRHQSRHHPGGRARGFYYAPDPSSQIACSIGGNVAENSGGVHCLKYGLTTNNVLGVEMVLMNGEVVRLGGKHLDAGGYDLLGLVIGSEGLLGVVTEVTVRILRKPESARAVLIGFPTSQDAGDCVGRRSSARGIIPAGMEMMDKPAIHAAEDFVHAGYPLDVEALLIVELDGPQAEVDHLLRRCSEIARDCGATTLRAATSRRSGCCSGPAARRRSRRSAGSRPTITAWTAPSRAPAARGAAAHARDVEATTACASPTCSMPATATCTR